MSYNYNLHRFTIYLRTTIMYDNYLKIELIPEKSLLNIDPFHCNLVAFDLFIRLRKNSIHSDYGINLKITLPIMILCAPW